METKYKIHFSYIITILVIIIIILSSVKWSEKSDLIKYISFASTIASLLLALLAIIYAYLSNSTFSKNISLINEVSNELKTNTANLTEISEIIERDIKHLPKAIAGMDKKVGEIPKLISEMTSKEFIRKEESNAALPNTMEDSSIETFLDTSSFNGLLSLFAVTLAYRKKAPLNIDDLSENVESIEMQYMMGYLIASSAFGIFNYKSLKSNWNITNMNSEFESKIEKFLEARGKEVQESLKEDEISFPYKDDITQVEQYFKD